jgi:hypothetical protein
MNGKPSSPVLSGLGASNGAWPLGSWSCRLELEPAGQRRTADLLTTLSGLIKISIGEEKANTELGP